MDFFDSVEFYILAVTIAILVVSFFLKSHDEIQSYSYIYQGYITFAESSQIGEEEYIETISCDNGTVYIIHHNMMLPVDATVNLKMNICGDSISCVEKMEERLPEEQVFCYDVKFKIKCLKYITYKIKYECISNGKWCNLSFTNNENMSVIKELKL